MVTGKDINMSRVDMEILSLALGHEEQILFQSVSCCSTIN